MFVEGDQGGTGQGVASLLALAGIGQRLLIGALTEGNALQADAEAKGGAEPVEAK